MPLPKKNKDEDRNQFLSRCMSDPNSKKEYPDNKQRIAVCLSKASEGLNE